MSIWSVPFLEVLGGHSAWRLGPMCHDMFWICSTTWEATPVVTTVVFNDVWCTAFAGSVGMFILSCSLFTESAELEISVSKKQTPKHQEMPRARHLLRVPSSCRSWHWHNPTWWWCYLRPTAPKCQGDPLKTASRRQSNCDWATLFLCLELDSHDARKAFHYLILLSRADFSWDSIALTTPQCASLILGQTCTLPSCSKPHSEKMPLGHPESQISCQAAVDFPWATWPMVPTCQNMDSIGGAVIFRRAERTNHMQERWRCQLVVGVVGMVGMVGVVGVAAAALIIIIITIIMTWWPDDLMRCD